MSEKNEFETIDFESWNDLKSDEKSSKNIFSDFETEKKEIEKEEKKRYNIFDKLNILLKVLQWVFVLVLLIFILWVSYIQIQKSETFANNEFLNPICSFFNWDLDMWAGWCSSITYNKNLIDQEIKTVFQEQSKKIFSILPIMYEKESYLNTKEIQFLVQKSQNKLKVLEIIEKFNYFLNYFTWFEKSKIKCFEFKIDSEKNFTMKCEAFSKWYMYDEIIWFSGNKNSKDESVSWTSISIANSFINYLEKNALKYFIVIDKQKVFESEQFLDTSNWYTSKTSFELKLKVIN